MANLRHFAPTEIKITKGQASRILKFFFPDQPIPADSLTNEDLSFSQALFVEAIDASREMGYVQILFDKAFMKVPNDFSFVQDIAAVFAARGLKDWFRHAAQKDLSDPKIYESVRRTIATNFRSVWAIRMQTGELTY